MHKRGRLWWHLLGVIALIAFALPLAASTAQNVQAASSARVHVADNVAENPQVDPSSLNLSGGACSSTSLEVFSASAQALASNCVVDLSPALAFNVVGQPHRVTFTCGPAAGTFVQDEFLDTVRPNQLLTSGGCFDVTLKVDNASGGAAVSGYGGRCGGVAADVTGSTLNCRGFSSPLGLRQGVVGGQVPVDPTASFEINPGFPGTYLFTASGYIPATAFPNSTCPAGTTTVPNQTVGISILEPPISVDVITETFCFFELQAQKKYLEVTNLFLFPTPPCSTGSPTAAQLLFSEAFKTFFGPSCELSVGAVGQVTIKTGINCATEPNGTPAPAEFGGAFTLPPGVTLPATTPGFTPPTDTTPGSLTPTYVCANGTLSVVNVTVPDNTVLPVNFTSTGPGGLTTSITGPTIESLPCASVGPGGPPRAAGPCPGSTGFGPLCAGTSTHSLATTGTFVGSMTGTLAFLCPTGPGTGTVQACTARRINTQPTVCSNFANFLFTLPQGRRVVPYVRWAGEKQVLTKCFGGFGLNAGAPVEFTLASGGSQAQAALIPAALSSSIPNVLGGNAGVPPQAGGTGAFQVSQDTVWTTTDQDGCATVILFAAGEGQVVVDASLFSSNLGTSFTNQFSSPDSFATGLTPLINEHAFEVFYLKLERLDLENIQLGAPPGLPSSTGFAAGVPILTGAPSGTTVVPSGFPAPPGTLQPGPGGVFTVSACAIDYVRAMVHGYLEIPGDLSGRPETTVNFNGTPAQIGGLGTAPNQSGIAAGSYVLPRGRWVLPEDWPVLATFAGFGAGGAPLDITPSSVMAWDLNSGWVFNPTGEGAVLCSGPQPAPHPNTSGAPVGGSGTPPAGGPIGNAEGDEGTGPTQVAYGPCYGIDAGGIGYSTADAGPNCGTTGPDPRGGITVGIGPFDITQACTNPYPLTYTPAGSSTLVGTVTNNETEFLFAPISANSTYLPNGTLSEWDTPMPPAAVSFGLTPSSIGFFNQVNKTGLYAIRTTFVNSAGATVAGPTAYPDPFYAEAIPANPLIPAQTNNGGYFWDTWGSSGGSVQGTLPGPIDLAGLDTTVTRHTGLHTGAGDVAVELRCSSESAQGSDDGQGFLWYTPATRTVTTTSGNALPSTAPAGCYATTNTDALGSGVIDTILPANCTAAGGTPVQVVGNPTLVNTNGGAACEVPGAPDTAPGGIVYTNTGSTCGTLGVPSSPTSVRVADISMFGANGSTVTVNFFDRTTGALVATRDATVQRGPDSNYLTATYDAQTDFNNGTPGTLTFTTGLPGCHPIYSLVAVAATFRIIPPTGSTATAGSEITIFVPGGAAGGAGFTASTTVLDVTANGELVLPLTVLAELGFCTPTQVITGNTAHCTLITNGFPTGSILEIGPNQAAVPVGRRTAGETGVPDSDASLFGGQGPYPFWQWVPNAGLGVNPATGAPQGARSATVYSDNHGESVVSLETGLLPTITPDLTVFGAANFGCPAGFRAILPSATATLATTCLLNLSALGSASTAPGGTAFPGIAGALAAFTGVPNAVCGTTNPTSGAFTVSPAPAAGTPVVGPNGPVAGSNQICVNKLGGVEIAPGATIGTATVQAVADYPYFRGIHPPIASSPAAIIKAFTSAFFKAVFVGPGITGTGTSTSTSFTPCTPGATSTTGAVIPCGITGPVGTTEFQVRIIAQDLCGNPIVGEPVDIFALGNAGAVVLAPNGPQIVPTSNTSATAVTDATGQVNLMLEVLNTALGTGGLTLKVVFPNEQIERFATVIPGTIPNQTVTQIYPGGWNMVGGPPNSNFGRVEALYSFSPTSGSYVNALSGATTVSSSPPACTGYFAYFSNITTVQLPATGAPASPVTCTLQPGWNLVGNPFTTNATLGLPAGDAAYWYNPQTGAYEVAGIIRLGGAVFVFNPTSATQSLTLTAT